MRRLKRAVLLVAVGLLVAPELAVAQEFCPKVQMFQAVGSGNRGNPDLTDTLRDEILRPERAQDGDPDLFYSTRVDYPAVSVKSLTGLRAISRAGGAYHKSVVKGKDWLRRHIKRKIDNCRGKTLVVLTGYSQGAQVVGDVYQELERKGMAQHVFGMVLFGDPKFNPKPAGRGSSQGKWRHTYRSGALGPRPVYGRYRLRVRSYCHKHDPVCQDGGSVNLSDHSNYAKTGASEPGEATDAGRWLSTRLRVALSRSLPPARLSEPRLLFYLNHAIASIAPRLGQTAVEHLPIRENRIGGIAATADHIFWTQDFEDGAIYRADMNGANKTLLARDSYPENGLILGEHYYWANQQGIARIGLDGSELDLTYLALPGTLYNADKGFVEPAADGALATDGSYFYFANCFANAIGRIAVDGSDLDVDFIASHDGCVFTMAVAGGYIFWDNDQLGASAFMARARADGSSADLHWRTYGGLYDDISSFATDGTYMYWWQTGRGKPDYLKRSSLEGREITQLLRSETFTGSPMTVAP